mgnify:CR=1 FL=1
MTPAALAYLGDSVIEVLARELLVEKGIPDSARLNTAAAKYVRATAQSEAVERLSSVMNDAELRYTAAAEMSDTPTRRARQAQPSTAAQPAWRRFSVGSGSAATRAERVRASCSILHTKKIMKMTVRYKMSENPVIEIKVRDMGTMRAELYPKNAPRTVENFLSLVDEKFFDGLIFHRVIKGFMIQGGGYDEQFGEHRAAPIKGEFAANGWMNNTQKHTRGTLSMARTSDPDSASSQFFIMHKDAPHLDAQYAAFGMLTDGFDVLDSIAEVRTGRYGYFSDVPRTPVVIESIRRV